MWVWWKQQRSFHSISHSLTKSHSSSANAFNLAEHQSKKVFAWVCEGIPENCVWKCATRLFAKSPFPCLLSQMKAFFRCLWPILSDLQLSVFYATHYGLIWPWNGVCQAPGTHTHTKENNPIPHTVYLVVQNKLSPWQIASQRVRGTAARWSMLSQGAVFLNRLINHQVGFCGCVDPARVGGGPLWDRGEPGAL